MSFRAWSTLVLAAVASRRTSFSSVTMSNPKTGTPGKAMAERAAKKAARAEAPAAE